MRARCGKDAKKEAKSRNHLRTFQNREPSRATEDAGIANSGVTTANVQSFATHVNLINAQTPSSPC